MPLIANRDKRKKIKVTEDVLSNVHEQMVQYCAWAGIADMGYFIEESAKYVFANDHLWQEFLDQPKE